VLRKIFGPQREEVTRSWRKLRNKEFHNLYSSPFHIIRVMFEDEMSRVGSTHGKDEKCTQNFGQETQM